MKINFLKFLPLFAALLLAIPSCKDDDEEDEKTSEVAVSSVALDKTTLEITIGETVTLKATVSPENATDKTVKWTSSDETIAKVDSKGVVTAVKEGSVKITATAEKYSTQTASCTITVKAATPSKVLVTSIALNKTATEITVGSDETLSVTKVLPDNATDKTYTWSSEDETIATVDQNGKVTAVAIGTVKIIATAKDGSGIKAECAVTVKAATVLSGVLVDGATIKVNFKWRDDNSGDYVQGVYNAQTGTFTVSKGGYYWGPDERAVYKVEKSGDNIIIGVGIYNYDMEGMVWTFDTTNDTYTYTQGRMLSSNPDEYGLISVTLNGTDITSQLTAQ